MGGTVYRTRRKPNFKKDKDTYGLIGEEKFIEIFKPHLKSKGKSIIDVRKYNEFRDVDIDFISTNKTLKTLNIDEILNDSDITKFEVKMDTRAIDTGNLPYEIISHGKLRGWSYVTKSDYVVFFLSNGDTKPKKMIVVDMPKWKKYVEDKKIFLKVNYIYNESIVDLLCKIDDLREKGVIVAEKDL